MKLSLLPKEDKFNRLMTELAAEAYQSVQLLKSFIDQKGENTVGITETKNKAKAIVTEITEELCRSYVTPFDREDIQGISDHLYKIPKIIEKIKERIALHNLPTAQGDFSRQVDIIVQEAQVMKEMIEVLLKNHGSTKVLEKVAILQHLEHQGDEIRNQLLRDLFNGNHEVRDLILRRDIYDMLEKVVDKFRDMASIALQVVLKHS